MVIRHFAVIAFLGLVSLAACSGRESPPAAPGQAGGGAVSALELSDDLFVGKPDGSFDRIPKGVYQVAEVGGNLVLRGGAAGERTLPATAITHGIDLAQAEAVVAPGEDDTEAHLVLAKPGGAGLAAAVALVEARTRGPAAKPPADWDLLMGAAAKDLAVLMKLPALGEPAKSAKTAVEKAQATMKSVKVELAAKRANPSNRKTLANAMRQHAQALQGQAGRLEEVAKQVEEGLRKAAEQAAPPAEPPTTAPDAEARRAEAEAKRQAAQKMMEDAQRAFEQALVEMRAKMQEIERMAQAGADEAELRALREAASKAGEDANRARNERMMEANKMMQDADAILRELAGPPAPVAPAPPPQAPVEEALAAGLKLVPKVAKTLRDLSKRASDTAALLK